MSDTLPNGFYADKEDEYYFAAVGNIVSVEGLAYSAKGTPYARFRLAANDPADKDNTAFYGCVCFGSLAENLTASLDKGTRVLVRGVLTWEPKKDNPDEYWYNIRCDEVGTSLRWATVDVARTTRNAPKTSAKPFTEADETITPPLPLNRTGKPRAGA